MVLTREETSAIPTGLNWFKEIVNCTKKSGIKAHVHRDLSQCRLKSTIERYIDPYLYNKISATIQPNWSCTRFWTQGDVACGNNKVDTICLQIHKSDSRSAKYKIDSFLNDSFLTPRRKTNSPLRFERTSVLKRSVMTMLSSSDGHEIRFWRTCCSDDLFKTVNVKIWKCRREQYMEHVLSLECCIRSITC